MISQVHASRTIGSTRALVGSRVASGAWNVMPEGFVAAYAAGETDLASRGAATGRIAAEGTGLTYPGGICPLCLGDSSNVHPPVRVRVNGELVLRRAGGESWPARSAP